MIDTDIIINTQAPSIFNFYKKNKISVVSTKYMPYTWDDSTRKMAFLRNNLYSKKYPLDSALNISLKNLYKFHNLSPQKTNFAQECTFCQNFTLIIFIIFFLNLEKI